MLIVAVEALESVPSLITHVVWVVLLLSVPSFISHEVERRVWVARMCVELMVEP